MGSISPHPFAGEELERQIRSVLLEPLVRGLRADRLDFTGFIYLGCMITDSGLKVIEINARFGDSEAEVVLPSIRSDFGALCRAVLDRRLGEQTLEVDGLSRCSVALTQGCLDPVDPLALPGWPFGAFSAGQPVRGLDTAPAADAAGTVLYFANLGLDEAGLPVTTGGRVLHVVGSGESPDAARDAAYRRIEDVSFPGMRYRTDIGAIPAMSVLI
jgi:phosphoribosylamine--glycine ligase